MTMLEAALIAGLLALAVAALVTFARSLRGRRLPMSNTTRSRAFGAPSATTPTDEHRPDGTDDATDGHRGPSF